MSQAEGGEQGDPLMPLVFSIGIQGTLEEVWHQLLRESANEPGPRHMTWQESRSPESGAREGKTRDTASHVATVMPAFGQNRIWPKKSEFGKAIFVTAFGQTAFGQN